MSPAQRPSSRWVALLVEGPHDTAVVMGLLLASGWREARKNEVSEEDRLVVDTLSGEPRRPIGLSRLLTRSRPAGGGHWLAIVECEGGPNALGKAGAARIAEVHRVLTGFGVIVDADDRTPQDRASAFAQRYAPAIERPLNPTPGTVAPGTPRAGLWVWPDNQRSGTLEDLLIGLGLEQRPQVMEDAARFIQAHRPEWQGSRRGKGVLGVAGQLEEPAVALQAALYIGRKRWFPPEIVEHASFGPLLSFIDQLFGDDQAST